jgi:DNA-binding phage protein
MMGYRFKRSVHRPDAEQQYIYAVSRMYRRLPQEQQARIRALCDETGGEYSRELLVFVTTDRSATSVCAEYPISKQTLYRAVSKYYEAFPIPFE